MDPTKKIWDAFEDCNIGLIELKGKNIVFYCPFCEEVCSSSMGKLKGIVLCARCRKRVLGHEFTDMALDFLFEENKRMKKIFEEKGLNPQETYINSERQKISCLCGRCGAEHLVSLKNVQKEGFSLPCIVKQRNLSNERVINIFKEKNCVFLGPYENNKVPTKYVCSCGKEAEVAISKITEKWIGCRQCSYKARALALRK
ncbi:hypothetical protein ISTM_62 [Insectomime virus]|nr:hypothetical protein ISTM_62 [Insectomime virus]